MNVRWNVWHRDEHDVWQIVRRRRPQPVAERIAQRHPDLVALPDGEEP